MKKFFVLILSVLFVLGLTAEGNNLPLKKVALFSSGVAYYEHSGEVLDSANFDFFFLQGKSTMF